MQVSEVILQVCYTIILDDSSKETPIFSLIAKRWLTTYILEYLSKQSIVYNEAIKKNKNRPINVFEVHDMRHYNDALRVACGLSPNDPNYYYDVHAKKELEVEDFGDVPKQVKVELDARLCSDTCLKYLSSCFADDHTARDAYVNFFRKYTA